MLNYIEAKRNRDHDSETETRKCDRMSVKTTHIPATTINVLLDVNADKFKQNVYPQV